ncbi:alkyl hydroperoxide reductase subunit F [Porphyromonas pogonae]|uniref:alkyl hydroperoxide reductase subunit F n=1 Tax=Porphyromonas pogonae TaxID=867595 RepID=UPI002E78AA38|nr:alkyl hydroperoxide reductase subunit F [Porphyromonas pogonae]
MFLDQDIINNLKGIFASLQNDYTLVVNSTADKNGSDLSAMCQEVASTSPRITAQIIQGDRLSLSLLRNGETTGVVFRGIPSGHEFTSFLISILNADGQGKNLPDESLRSRIERLNTPIQLTTYVSLSCTNCPDVVQSLNIMALYNQGISHEMVDGAIYKEEVESLGISAVPAVYANGKELHMGQSSLGELLLKLEKAVGVSESEGKSVDNTPKSYDLLVVGGGPAGAAAAIYSARKGLRVAIVAGRIGGQVNETTGIENIPSVVETTGTQLAADLRRHAEVYHIDLLEQREVTGISLQGEKKLVATNLGEQFIADQVIIATGASWRKLGVPGEEEHIGRGVAFCPHCDGPFFKGKDIAVVGGGNSGIEAAIDLAGISSRVTVLEFMPELKADSVLQEKLKSLPNVEVLKNVATQEVVGENNKVKAIKLKHRESGEELNIDLSGIFVQIGLAPNTKAFSELVETNRMGEIVVDERCRTSVPGIYAAGDCTTVPYKQIVIAMGEGAKAALTAFDDRIRM